MFETFCETYARNLRSAHKKYRSEYLWPESEFDNVLGRMIEAIKKGTFNKDSRDFRMTCTELGIPHTYKAIAEFLGRSA